MQITATIITLNEAENIRAACESVAWADEILVVDSESTDATREIAAQCGARVIANPWPGFSAQKQFAVDAASHDWIFSLDADERLSPELTKRILDLKSHVEPEPAGFEMPRRTFYLGRWIKHSGWWPDHKVRLYDRRHARWRGDFVHEALDVKGLVKRVDGNLLHYTVRDASEHHLRMDRYTTLAAEELFTRGKRASIGSLFVSPMVVFLRSYVFKLGFLDGIPGLAIARFAAHYEFLKNLKLWEMRAKRDA